MSDAGWAWDWDQARPVPSAEKRKSNWRKGIQHIQDPIKRQQVIDGRADRWAQKNMRRMHEQQCPICKTGQVGPEDRAEMEALFADWVSAREISEAYDIDKKWVVWHFRFTGKYVARETNRGGVFKELVRRGMAAVAKGGIKAPKIAVRDIIQANNSLVQMEGGFKQHIDFTGKLEAIGRQYDQLSAEQTVGMMEQLIMQLANPNRAMLSGNVVAIPVEAKEVHSNVDNEDGKSDVLPDPAAPWWPEGDEGNQHD